MWSVDSFLSRLKRREKRPRAADAETFRKLMFAAAQRAQELTPEEREVAERDLWEVAERDYDTGLLDAPADPPNPNPLIAASLERSRILLREGVEKRRAQRAKVVPLPIKGNEE